MHRMDQSSWYTVDVSYALRPSVHMLGPHAQTHETQGPYPLMYALP